jgi:hypothetical protein
MQTATYRARVLRSIAKVHITTTLLSHIKKFFHNDSPFREGELKNSQNVVVCFHGHTGNKDMWNDDDLIGHLPKKSCLLRLNAPYKIEKDSYEWFTYKNDTEASPQDISVYNSTLAQYMNVTNLTLKDFDQFYSTITHIKYLYTLLSLLNKRVYFVGTSQGAVTAFMAGALIVDETPSNFRGVFAHRMAGYYDKFKNAINANYTIRVVTVVAEDPEAAHWQWLKVDYEELLRSSSTAFGASFSKPEFTVTLDKGDNVVPFPLERFLNHMKQQQQLSRRPFDESDERRIKVLKFAFTHQ